MRSAMYCLMTLAIRGLKTSRRDYDALPASAESDTFYRIGANRLSKRDTPQP